MDAVYIPNDYLMHWKYIERYKRGGKWRYVYADSGVHDRIKRNINEEKSSSLMARRYQKNANDAEQQSILANRDHDYVTKQYADETYENASKEADYWRRLSNRYKVQADTIINSNSGSKALSNIKDDIISAGKSAVDSILNLFKHSDSSTRGESIDAVYIPSDYLMHWKYIERYKRGGKWRYVYADDSVHGSINRHMKEFERERNLADHEYDMANEYAKASDSTFAKMNPDWKDFYDEAWRNHTKSAELFDRWAYEDYDEAETLVEKYSISTHLMNVKYDVISAGKSAVDYIFNLFKHSDSSDLYLEHHGILGQKWGVRRYQNTDGTLTPLGKKRRGSIRDYSDDELRSEIERSKLEKEYNREVGYGPKYYKGKTFKNPFTKKTVTSFASDQELEAYVNRRYLEMKVAEADAREVEQGLNYINNIMRTAGNVISTASSATKLISDIDKFVSGRKDKDDERKHKQQDDAKRKAIYDSTKELSTDSLESMTKRVKARWDYVDAVTGGGSNSNSSKSSKKDNKKSVFKVKRKK